MATKSPKARRNVLDPLGTCPLYVAVRQLPSLTTDDSGRLTDDVSVEALTSKGPEGEVLLVFTSNAEIRKRRFGSNLAADRSRWRGPNAACGRDRGRAGSIGLQGKSYYCSRALIGRFE